MALLSELGIGYVLKRSALALPFVLAALPLIFTVAGRAAAQPPAGAMDIDISGPGLERFLSIALKSWLSVQAAIVLAASTPFPDLLLAMRAVRIPRLLVAIFGLMWRYLFVLVDEALRLMRARAARSGDSDRSRCRNPAAAWPGGRASPAAWPATCSCARFERSDRIYMAMLSRGYDGEVRTCPLPPLRTVALGRPGRRAGLSGLAANYSLTCSGVRPCIIRSKSKTFPLPTQTATPPCATSR